MAHSLSKIICALRFFSLKLFPDIKLFTLVKLQFAIYYQTKSKFGWMRKWNW